MSESSRTTKAEARFVAPDYSRKIDFRALAACDSRFKECIQSNEFKVDFHNAEHLRALTKALLLRDFKIKLYLPADRLCPPVPIRWLYVQWVQSLVDGTSSPFPSLMNVDRKVHGLDIGIGASCIYPLLACTSRSNWTMFGTDIDDTNYLHGIHNVAVNELDHVIKLVRTQSDGPLIPLQILGIDRLDFTMCNPPFFASEEELNRTYFKEQQPSSVCTGAAFEMITQGGETEYVCRMIEESCVLKEKVRWYTVQLGKLSSVHTIVQRLKAVNCSNWAINVLQPGGHTVRWALGWSWDSYRAPDAVARHATLLGSNVLMEPAESEVIKLPWDPQYQLTSILENLPWIEAKQIDRSWLVFSDCAVWSRQERRKRAREGMQQDPTKGSRDTASTSLKYNTDVANHGFSVSCIHGNMQDTHENTVANYTVHVRWLMGHDRTIFESFCGMLRRKLKERSVSPVIEAE